MGGGLFFGYFLFYAERFIIITFDINYWDHIAFMVVPVVTREHNLFIWAITTSTAVSEGQHQGFSLWNEADNNDSVIEIDDGEFTNSIATTVNTRDDPISQFMETVPRSENGSAGDPPELYLPGLIIHMVPHQRGSHTSLWKCCTVLEKAQSYKAYIANRESFKDIIVSPSMFLDHLPWR